MEKTYAQLLQRGVGDTGSPEYQIGRLTDRITAVAEHLKKNKKDSSSRRGLITMVGNRRRLLAYLARVEPEEYEKVLKVLQLDK